MKKPSFVRLVSAKPRDVRIGFILNIEAIQENYALKAKEMCLVNSTLKRRKKGYKEECGRIKHLLKRIGFHRFRGPGECD